MSDLLCLTRREREILFSGLPHSAIVLYLWLRERMTWSTRLVGAHARARVNWQAAREALAIERRPGWITEPTKSSARRTARQLVRAGLIVMRSNSTERQLIFECVLAPRKSSVQNMADTPPRPHGDTPLQRGKPPHGDIPKIVHGDTHLDFVVPVITNKTRARENAPVDNLAPAALAFPPQCTPEQNRALGALMGKSKLNGSAQPILDEIRASYDRNPVCKNPIALANKLIGLEKSGAFNASDRAMKFALARSEMHRNIAAPHNESSQGKPRRSGKAAREAIAASLKMLKGSGP